MIKPIVKDILFLGQKSSLCTKEDLPLAKDLEDTLAANRECCVGMAANMIGVKKRAIIADMIGVMFNPVIVSRHSPYNAEEGCLSLSGTRSATRYETIEVEYLDASWKAQKRRFSGFIAQIIQHECDHLDGVII